MSLCELVNAVNYKHYINELLSIATRKQFISTIETILVMNHSLWFTEIGDIYLANYGPDCSLPSYKPERVRRVKYPVVIYNRYE